MVNPYAKDIRACKCDRLTGKGREKVSGVSEMALCKLISEATMTSLNRRSGQP